MTQPNHMLLSRTLCALVRSLFAALVLAASGPALAQDKPLQPKALAAALASAAPGDVLRLGGGDFGVLTLKSLAGTAQQPITILSANPANPARFSRLEMSGASHLRLQGLLFDYLYTTGDKPHLRPFQIHASRGIVLEGNVFDGDLAGGNAAGTATGMGFPTAFGLGITSSADITLTENEIRGFFRGLVVNDSTDLVIQANDLHGLRMDGMNFAQVERVLIEANHIHDFNRILDSTDHSDMIQFWTNGTERPSSDITIRRNVLNSGAGWYTQSIFMRNDLVDRGLAGAAMFYRNVTIEQNVILNAHLHGITVGETAGLVIANNSVIRNAASEGQKADPGLWTPQIRVAPTSTNVAILRNAVAMITGPDGQTGWQVEGNLAIQDRSPSAPNYYDKVFTAARTGDPRNLASFAYRPGGPLDGAGIGSDLLEGISPGLPGTLIPLIRVIPDAEFANRFTFDGGASALPDGVDPDSAGYRWTLGEEAVETGRRVTYTFAGAGVMRIGLSVTTAEGDVAETEIAHFVPGPVVLRYDPDMGRFTSYVGSDPVSPDLPLEKGSAILGQGEAVIEILPPLIAPFFDSNDFELTLRVRGRGGAKAAGELLRIHQNLLVTVTPRGTLDIRFDTDTADQLKLLTPVVRLFSDDWRDITFDYSERTGIFQVLVDGRSIARGKTHGRTRPLEHWGLALGNPFSNRKTFNGEMERLVLKVNRDAFAPVP